MAEDKVALEEMIGKSKQMGVPVITVGDELMVGFVQSKLDGLLT